MKQTGYDMLYLVGCGLNETIPDKDRIKEMDMERLYKLSKMHSLSALVAMTLESASVATGDAWTQEKGKAVRKSILLDTEYKKISDFMEENGIWHMPLKGRILQTLYPKKGMRQMADTDILFDKTYRKTVCDYMAEQGYEVKLYGNCIHDSYLKEPIYNFEMHVELFSDYNNKKFFEYYEDIKERMILLKNRSYEYCLSKEDFYIYVTLHEYKHYAGGGTGLRSLVDSYVYLKAYKDCLDFAYIEKELEALGVGEYERKSRALSEKIFMQEGVERLSEEEREMLKYYLFSGTYGTQKQRVENGINRLRDGGDLKRAKIVYFFRRLFPDSYTLQVYCPAVKKYPILKPYAWGKRIVLCIKRSGFHEIKHVITSKATDRVK